jgi:hypothetical protein
MKNNKQIIVSGYNLFFTDLQMNKVKEIVNVLSEGTTELSAKTITAQDYGNEWCITYMFKKNMEVKSDALVDVVMVTRELGIKLADGVGCTYNGSEVYVNEAAVEVGKTAGMMVR